MSAGTVDSGETVDPIIGIVVELLDTEGYDAVALREVARRARVSLATIYKRFGTRDELIVAALEWWMDTNRYAKLLEPEAIAASGESLYAGLMHMLRTIFEPWEQHPQMLKSYFRARSGPGGERLIERGVDAVVPVAKAVLAQVDQSFASDLELILTGVVFGFLGRYTQGEIDVSEIVPGLERAVFWLTTAYEKGRPQG
ncbi:TetR family transcriptional regulator [Mycobacterium florentinum]|uniref:TetR family transcriptional regulator n=1 Tax=Mycobacterium florentinum TaxID=292462 RepID=A0A1X1U7U8_MYCFL|nr:TetR family transcriptional regulator [Mycobacterium florentinum]MCV7409580.1 TetR/AcrR family transcriptional regulator [Mycobacterium florentinum]ORV52739.1 TetR family transcriptional regulator [Mycobacterium florentinum]BBX78874.1 TetR family transcriptional regulator [Mycobacterium florentinum]